MIPCDLWMSDSMIWSCALSMPISTRSSSTVFLSRRRITTRSPYTVGVVERRMSMSRPASFTRMRPSCGSRFSAILRPPMIFTREMMEFWKRLGGRITSCSTPSPEPHADVLLLRLDVDVAGPLLGGAEEERVDQADDGRLVAGVEQVLRLLQLVGDGVEVAGFQIADQLLRLVLGAVVDGVDAVEDRLGGHQ